MGGESEVWREEMNTCDWWGKLRERDCFEDLNIDENVILKWIFKKLCGRCESVLFG
jgi:hypothetical protein